MEKWLMIIAICDCILVGISLLNTIATTYFTLKNEKRNNRLLEQNDKTNEFISSFKESLATIQWGYNNCSARLKKLEESISAEQKDSAE